MEKICHVFDPLSHRKPDPDGPVFFMHLAISNVLDNDGCITYDKKIETDNC